MSHIKLLHSFDEYSNLEEQWDELLDNAIFNSFFCCYSWVNSWWLSFAEPDDKLIIIVAEHNGQLAAIAPLMIRRVKEYGFSLNMLRFIGVPNADRCDIVIRSGEETVIPELFEFLHKRVQGWDQFHLNEVPVESLFAKWLQANRSMVYVEPGSECPYVVLSAWDNWDDYYKNLSKKTRLELNRKNNALNKEGCSRYQHILSPDPEEVMLDHARKLEKNSAKAKRIEHLALADGKHWKFQKMLLKYQGKYQVLLSCLERNRKLIGYLYGYIYNKQYYAYNTAFSDSAVQFYPGKLIVNEAVHYCLENNIAVFDFLRGATHLKSRWANDSKCQQNIYVLRNKPINWLYVFSVFKIRPFIKHRIFPLLKKLRMKTTTVKK